MSLIAGRSSTPVVNLLKLRGGNDEDTLLLFLLSNDLLLTLLLLLVEVVKSILERKLYVEFFLNNLCVLMTNLLKDSKVGEYFEGND